MQDVKEIETGQRQVADLLTSNSELLTAVRLLRHALPYGF